MKILQLCAYSNLWNPKHKVTSIDLKNGLDVLFLPDDFGKQFDFIISAPPCDQFTAANSLRWDPDPFHFILIAKKCLTISLNSCRKWLIENPPGRIEKLIPALTQYRVGTWHGHVTNKSYVIYSNFLFLMYYEPRYGKPGTILNWNKKHRELWQTDFISDIEHFIFQ